MALAGTGGPGGWRYSVQMNPPGFVSGPSQSSRVTYTQPREDFCTQSRMRLLLRDLSRARDVRQGIAVAKTYEGVPRLLGSEGLNQIGPLNHPTP